MKKRFRSLLALGVLAPAALVAQQNQEPVSKDTASTAGPSVTPIDFSGVVFGNYHYEGDESARSANSFQIERSYLTFKMPAGDRAHIRVTADVYNTSSTSSSSYAFRAKYAYLNYNFYKSGSASIDGRAGIIQTQQIDQIENFWPRYIAPVPSDRARLFSSADVGAAALVGLPSNMGELYLGVLNGAGYETPSDPDRFKDYTARLTLTPFGSSDMWLLKNMTLLGYYYKGTVEGDITADSVGQKNDRYGAFLGLKDPRFTFGLEYDQGKNEFQNVSAGTPPAAPGYTVGENTGRLWSVFGTARPFQMMDPNGLPVGVVLRYDQLKPNTDLDENYHFFVAGLTYDLTKRVQFALDYQEQIPHDGLSVTASKTYFAHWVANF
jgi:hypothetical protein